MHFLAGVLGPDGRGADASFGSRATPTSSLSDDCGRPDRGDRGPARAAPLRRGRAARGRSPTPRPSSSTTWHARAADFDRPGLRQPRRRSASTRLLELARARPPRTEGHRLEAGHPTTVRVPQAGRAAHPDPAARHPRPPSRTTPSTRRSRRSSRPTRDPKVAAAEGDGLPHRKPVAHARVARRDGRGGQAGGLPRRAEGALRRTRNIEWSRALERAGVDVVFGVPAAEGAREAHDARPPRARRDSVATSTSAPATTTPRTRSSYEDLGLFTADQEIARRRRRRLQRGHRPGDAGRLSQAARRTVVPPRRDPARDRRTAQGGAKPARPRRSGSR